MMLFCDLFVFKEDPVGRCFQIVKLSVPKGQRNRTNAPPPRMMDKGSRTKTMLMFRVSSETDTTAVRLLK